MIIAIKNLNDGDGDDGDDGGEEDNDMTARVFSSIASGTG